jgi:peptidoglycan/xylan/chitin deacetylase (PgdA/CDA1 family)
MKRAIKTAVAATPLWQLTGLLRRGGCAVLTYHRVGRNRDGFKHISADDFRRQMRWLREHCSIVAPTDFRRACARMDRLRPSVMVTFDDGYRDYHDVAYPILRELRIPAINFIVTGFADQPDRLFWWDQVDLAAWASPRAHVDAFWRSGERVAMDRAGREHVRMDIRRYIWSRPDEERLATLEGFFSALDVRPDQLRRQRQVMTWDEIRAVGEFTTIGGHTDGHPLVSRVGEAELRREVVACRDRIATEVGRPTTFAYPSGASSDTARRVLREEGFELAFSGVPGVNRPPADWLEIKRINAPAAAEQLAYLLSGIPARFAA